MALIWTNDEGEEKFFTFADIKRESDQTAAYFASLGIGHGDMVMIILKRRYEWWLTMLALHKLGAIAIPATHMLTKHDIVYRNNRASVRAIVCVGEDYVLTQVSEAMSGSPTVHTLISVGPEVPDGFHDWHKEWKNAPAFVRPNHVNVADTGWGKAVWGKFYGQWFAGAAVFVFDHEKFTAEKILRKIEQYHITSFCAPPTVYRFMIREDFSQYDLSSLRYCCTAGEALNAAVYDKFYELTGIRLMEGFGQTETCMTLGTMPWMTPKPGSMGKPNAQYDIDLLKPDGTPCEDGEKGQIVVRVGDVKPLGLFKGYYRDDKLTRQAWHDGIYYTGDMAWRDEDGYYWFVGRIDDVIKSSGYRIGPFEIENEIMKLPYVLECAVTSVPDPIRGQAIKASIVLANGEEGTDKLRSEIMKSLKKNIASYKWPKILDFTKELPKTISGKIRRKEIKENDWNENEDNE